LKKGQIGYPETSLTDYQPKPRNIPEGRRPHIHRGGILKSLKLCNCLTHTHTHTLQHTHTHTHTNDNK